jgi:hypothetical protein
MQLNMQKQEFSKAYARAVASVCGYAEYIPAVDDDSVDIGLALTGGGGSTRSPRLEIQLKCTSTAIPAAGDLSFPLPVKNYEDLRADDVLVPRILVVVHVPESPRDWLDHRDLETLLKYCAHWLSLRGWRQTTNESTVTVPIPRDNRFTKDSLLAIMSRIGNGGLP